MVVRLEIDGEWYAADFAGVFKDLEYLVDVQNGGDAYSTDAIQMDHQTVDNKLQLRWWWTPLPKSAKISSIKYSSPGWIDIAGLGKLAEEFRLFLQYIIDLFVHRNDRALEHEDRLIGVIERRAKFVENIQGVDPRLLEYVKSGSADHLVEAVCVGRVTSVRLIEPDTHEQS